MPAAPSRKAERRAGRNALLGGPQASESERGGTDKASCGRKARALPDWR
jgi:hypothetical protein